MPQQYIADVPRNLRTTRSTGVLLFSYDHEEVHTFCLRVDSECEQHARGVGNGTTIRYKAYIIYANILYLGLQSV